MNKFKSILKANIKYYIVSYAVLFFIEILLMFKKNDFELIKITDFSLNLFWKLLIIYCVYCVFELIKRDEIKTHK